MTAVAPKPAGIDSAATDFAVHTVAGDGGDRVVVRGELDIATAPLLTAVLDGVCQRGPGLVEVDLSDVTFLDGSAVTGLGAADRRVAAAGGTLVLCDPGRLARRVLGLTRFGDVVRVSEDSDAAPRSATRHGTA